MPAAVHLVLRDADPSGIVVATRDNWTGKAYSLPVGDLQHLLPALSGAGVYVLLGEDASDDSPPVIYVGEAEDITRRLTPSHAQFSRDDVLWRRIVVFGSQSNDLHKAHVRWLEAELVRLARVASRCRLSNGNTPPSPKLPEFDEVFVRSFLDNMLALYPLLGIDAFTPSRATRRQTPAPSPGTGNASSTIEEELLLRIKGEVRARARVEADQRITILSGSQITRVGRESEAGSTAARRKLLVDNQNVTESDEEWWVLNVDHGPLSPSAAAKLVVGYSINGRINWVTDSGATYADLVGKTDEGTTPLMI